MRYEAAAVIASAIATILFSILAIAKRVADDMRHKYEKRQGIQGAKLEKAGTAAILWVVAFLSVLIFTSFKPTAFPTDPLWNPWIHGVFILASWVFFQNGLARIVNWVANKILG